MALEIKVPPLATGSTEFHFSCPLDGVVFVFDLLWNAMGEFWVLRISDQDMNILVTFPIRVGMLNLSRHRDPLLPAGDIMAIDTSGQDEDPGQADLGSRVKLMYLTIDDLETP